MMRKRPLLRVVKAAAALTNILTPRQDSKWKEILSGCSMARWLYRLHMEAPCS